MILAKKCGFCANLRGIAIEKLRVNQISAEMEKNENTGGQTVDTSSVGKEKKGFNIKILLFGLPIFIVQLVAVYFITANFLLNKMHASNGEEQNAEKADSTEVVEEGKETEFGKFIHPEEDIIVNPAGTDGRRLLMVSLGFDIPSEENKKELEEKSMLLRDAAISVMSSKDLQVLGNMAYRDTLRIEMTNRLKQLMPKVTINTIYFSKYVLQ